MNHSNKDAMLSFNQIRLLTAILSLLLSGLAFYLDDLINRDGVMYMEMVQAYLDGGLEATAKIYDWPFFAIVTAWLSRGLSLPIELTAIGLNSVLFVVFTDALLLISRRLLPNLQQVLIAAVLILSFYSINEYRDYIIRDIGYWAFASLALYQIMRYVEDANYHNAIFWQLFALAALLFRVEGFVLILLLPFYVFFISPFRVAAKQLLQLNSLIVPFALLSVVLTLSITGWAEAFNKLNNYTAYLNIDSLQFQMEQKLTIFEGKVLNKFSEDYSVLILYSGLFIMLLFKLIEGISGGYLILFGLAVWLNKDKLKTPSRGLLIWFVAINVVILTAFVFHQYFVVSRYCIIAVAGIFLLMLPYLTNLIEQVIQQRRYWMTGLVGFVVLAGVIDTFHSTNSKTYIKETAIWASHHLQAEDRLLTDDEFLQYYLQREQTAVTITYRPEGLGDYRGFDYVLVVEKGRRDKLSLSADIDLELVYQQKNERKNKASIYRVVSHAN